MNEIEIYKTADASIEVQVSLKGETVWLNRHQLALLFDRDVKTIGKHINNIFSEGELEENVVVAKFATTTQHGAIKDKLQTKNVEHYNLDVIISVGYRVKSKRGTQFRQWATQRLKDYLVQGYAINEKRLAEKQQQVEHLKTSIRILSRAITQQALVEDSEALMTFANGLQLLDDYDHEQLDLKGKTAKDTKQPRISAAFCVVTSVATGTMEIGPPPMAFKILPKSISALLGRCIPSITFISLALIPQIQSKQTKQSN